MLKSWEKPNTFLNRVLEISATLLESRLKWARQKLRTRTWQMLMSGFQQRLSRKSRSFNLHSTVRCLKLAFLKFSMSSILFGVTSWGKKIKRSKENSPFRSKIFVDNLWQRRHLMRMSLKEKFPDWRKSSHSYKCRSTIKRDKLSKMRIKMETICQAGLRIN